MKKFLKIFGISLVVIAFVALVAAVSIPYFYKDEIMHVVTEKIGKQIKSDVSLSKVDVSVFGNIPNISIRLHDVCAKSTETFRKNEFPGESLDTALYAKKVLLSFNVFDFLFKNYVVQEIVVQDAAVNFFKDSKKHHNWEFSIESDSTGEDMFVELSKIRFYNTQAKYVDIVSKVNATEWFDKINFSGKFRGEDFNLNVYAAFSNKMFLFEKKNYFPKSSFKCDVVLLRDSATYVVRKLKVETPVGTILSDGSVELLKNDEYKVNLNVNVETSVDKIFKVMPKSTVDSLAPYKLKSDIYVEGNVNGKITKKTMPALKCNVACTNGSVVFEKTKYEFATKGSLKTENLSVLKSYEYVSSATTVSTGNSKLSLQNFSFSNLESPIFAVEGLLKLNVDDIDMLMKIEDYGISGKFEGSVKGNGRLQDVTEFSKDFFKKTKFEADLHCSNVSISAPENSPYDFQNVSGHLLFSNGDIAVDSVTGKLQYQNFTLQGKASNFVSYMFFDDVDTHCNLNCSIESINLTPFYEHYESLSSSNSTGKILGSIRFEAKKLDFDPYYLMNAAAIIRFTENTIELSEVNATTLQGKLVAGSLQLIDLPEKRTKCVASGKIEKMSAKEIFKTFNDFDQTVITSKQLDGLLSGKFQYSSDFDAEFNPIYSTTNVLADVEIEDGSMNNVETLLEIGKKMKMQEEFSNVSFSTIKNTICIKNDTLFIPDMKIKSSAFEMSFAGKHNIENNNFNYYVTVFLKKTLSLKFHRKNKDSEDFGDIDKNSDGNFKVPIKIFGNPDDFKIDYDFRKSRENVKTSINEQKSEWKEIFKKDDDEEREVPVEKKREEQPIKSDFEIEY
ncbi:MAG: hypothetical protein MJ198_00690 [Bacteroidales bacterium]|nr:hypothetical protein [Bacteroidales bacterium]